MYASKGSKFEENIVDSPVVGDLASLATAKRKWLVSMIFILAAISDSIWYRSSFVTPGLSEKKFNSPNCSHREEVEIKVHKIKVSYR